MIVDCCWLLVLRLQCTYATVRVVDAAVQAALLRNLALESSINCAISC